MIYRTELVLRRLRRWLSRNEWAVRLLGLPVSRGTASAPGLVLIQIDGLSHEQLGRALANGRMPFLKRLLGREGYRLHRLYSGVPSGTPAVQGELFYGVKGAVPAFGYLDREAGRVRRMYDPEAAAGIEKTLAAQGEPLLAGGSAYSDIFTGGAAESHFCPASLGWRELLQAANPLALIFLVCSNALSVLRVLVLLPVELVIAVVDLVRGLIDGRDFFLELRFVPTRVAICILLRELIAIGAQMDVARGLPVVHLNFLGYDEQAHRRGPASRFAHWSLKGIDGAIARIWRAARRSERRSYDVWIYSDHGQEPAVPYARLHGRSVEQAVTEVFDRLSGETGANDVGTAGAARGEQSGRVRLLGGRRTQRLLPVYAEAGQVLESGSEAPQPTVVAMGPVGLVYPGRPLTAAQRDRAARDLVAHARVPLVLADAGSEGAFAWTGDGLFRLPRDAAQVLGADHPFLAEAAADLVALCRHPDAGDLVLCGWAKGTEPCSFPLENGAHGGAGPEETAAFALLPAATPAGEPGKPYLRPLDLRRAALRALGRGEANPVSPPKPRTRDDRRLRIMTYNVHRCTGMDGKLSPERIARVIAAEAPDVVALQELDVGRARSGGVDQAHEIARHLEMEFHFHPALAVEEELYGDAILTNRPMRLVRAGPLPVLSGVAHLEPRGALWVAVEVAGREVQIINTHLGLIPRERRLQVEALLGPDWLGHPECASPVVLCGDLNAIPSSPVCRRLGERLRDSQKELEAHRPMKTFYGRYPTARIDHVFADPEIEVLSVAVPSSQLTRIASDHLPLVVDLRIPELAEAPERPVRELQRSTT